MTHLRLALLLVLLAIASSCQTGPLFQPLDSIPSDKALVYIYRLNVGLAPPGAFISPARVYVVYAGDRPIVRLIPGGYSWFLTSRREVEFWAEIEARSSVTLDLEPGRTYYLRGDLTYGWIEPHPRLTPVPEILALAEIAECRLFGAPETSERSVQQAEP